jgi:hypothetical protein
MARQGRGISRREFGKRAALGAAATALAPGRVLGDVPPTRVTAGAMGVEQDQKLPAESQAEIEEKVAAIFRKYGSRLSEAQKADIRRIVTEGQKPLETMRAFALDNADQPANVMRIYPDGAAARARRG